MSHKVILDIRECCRKLFWGLFVFCGCLFVCLFSVSVLFCFSVGWFSLVWFPTPSFSNEKCSLCKFPPDLHAK